MVGALLVLSGSQALLLFIVGPLFKLLFNAQGEASPDISLTRLLVPLSRVLPTSIDFSVQLQQAVVAVPVLLVFTGLINGIATYLYQVEQSAIAMYLAKHYRDALFEAIVGKPFLNVAGRSPGYWMSMIMNDVMYLQTRFSDIVAGLLKDGLSIIVCLIALTYIHWPSGVVLWIAAPIIAFGMGRTGRKISRYAEDFQREVGKISGKILDIRRRFSFIRSQNGGEFERSSFGEMNNNYYKKVLRSILVRSAFAPGVELLGFGIFALFLYCFNSKIIFENGSGNIVLQFFVALGIALRPLRTLGEQLASLHETKGALRESLQVLTVASAYPATNQEESVLLHDSWPKIWKLSSCILIAGRESDPIEVRCQELRFEAGKSYVVVGESGIGKSTWLRMLAGLIAPVKWVADTEWSEMKQVADLVSQHPYFFEGTFRENLCYGSPRAYSDAEIFGVLEISELSDFIKSLPEGVETNFHPLHTSISGGQLQRFALARGLLRRKRLWLFDEVTASVDPEMEERLIASILKSAREQQAIVVWVTHRLDRMGEFDGAIEFRADSKDGARVTQVIQRPL